VLALKRLADRYTPAVGKRIWTAFRNASCGGCWTSHDGRWRSDPFPWLRKLKTLVDLSPGEPESARPPSRQGKSVLSELAAATEAAFEAIETIDRLCTEF